MENSGEGGKRRVYRSMMEVEREFFPNSYKKKLEEERSKEPGEFGTGLAKEILEKIREEFAK